MRTRTVICNGDVDNNHTILNVISILVTILQFWNSLKLRLAGVDFHCCLGHGHLHARHMNQGSTFNIITESAFQGPSPSINHDGRSCLEIVKSGIIKTYYNSYPSGSVRLQLQTHYIFKIGIGLLRSSWCMAWRIITSREYRWSSPDPVLLGRRSTTASLAPSDFDFPSGCFWMESALSACSAENCDARKMCRVNHQPLLTLQFIIIYLILP